MCKNGEIKEYDTLERKKKKDMKSSYCCVSKNIIILDTLKNKKRKRKKKEKEKEKENKKENKKERKRKIRQIQLPPSVLSGAELCFAV